MSDPKEPGPRDMVQLVENMLQCVPPEEEDLISGLNSCKESFAFAAPENQYPHLMKTVNVLSRHLGSPDTLSGWQRRIFEIWMDKSPSAEEVPRA